jgi:hypothetical protein
VVVSDADVVDLVVVVAVVAAVVVVKKRRTSGTFRKAVFSSPRMLLNTNF